MRVIVKDVLKHLNRIGEKYIFFGDENEIVQGYSSLDNYKPGSIT
mgnify:FL=1